MSGLVTYQVVIPPGVVGGQLMQINQGGTVFQFTAPPNAVPGQLINVQAPAPVTQPVAQSVRMPQSVAPSVTSGSTSAAAPKSSRPSEKSTLERKLCSSVARRTTASARGSQRSSNVEQQQTARESDAWKSLASDSLVPKKEPVASQRLPAHNGGTVSALWWLNMGI